MATAPSWKGITFSSHIRYDNGNTQRRVELCVVCSGGVYVVCSGVGWRAVGWGVCSEMCGVRWGGVGYDGVGLGGAWCGAVWCSVMWGAGGYIEV